MRVRDDRQRYPMACVLRGHRWFRYPGAQGWYRFGQCRRCETVQPPAAPHPGGERDSGAATGEVRGE